MKIIQTLFLSLLGVFCLCNAEVTDTSSRAIYKEKPTLCLYYMPWCPHSQDVLDYLNSIHKTLPMENLADNAKAKTEMKALGGKMQVPCLSINGTPLYESGDILSWLMHHIDLLEDAPSK